MSAHMDRPETQETKGPTARTLLLLLFGPIAWAAHHMTMYASHTLVCSLGLAGSSFAGQQVMQTISVVASSVALAVCAAPLVVPDKLSRAIGIYQGSDWRFYRGTSALLAVLAAAGIVWNTAMTFVIPACLSLR